MLPLRVLVTFYSRRGATERLATAAAVGAVQARAAIRLRRLADAGTVPDLAGFAADEKEHWDRMHREYVPPAEADVLWADVLVFGVPADFTGVAAEWTGYLEMLGRLHAEGKLQRKAGAVVGSEAGVAALAAVLPSLGLTPAPPPDTLDVSGDTIAQAMTVGRAAARAVPAGEDRS